MKETVQAIITTIDKGLYFDSHFVIDTVIRDHSDIYLNFAAEHRARSRVTEYVHSEIAKTISSFDGTIVRRVNGDADSISYNIRGNASKCALWVRV